MKNIIITILSIFLILALLFLYINRPKKRIFTSPDGIYTLIVKNKFVLIPQVGRAGGGSKEVHFILKKDGKIISNSNRFSKPLEFRSGDIDVEWKMDRQLVQIAFASYINLDTGKMLK